MRSSAATLLLMALAAAIVGFGGLGGAAAEIAVRASWVLFALATAAFIAWGYSPPPARRWNDRKPTQPWRV
jgi:hypothetical protein